MGTPEKPNGGQAPSEQGVRIMTEFTKTQRDYVLSSDYQPGNPMPPAGTEPIVRAVGDNLSEVADDETQQG